MKEDICLIGIQDSGKNKNENKIYKNAGLWK